MVRKANEQRSPASRPLLHAKTEKSQVRYPVSNCASWCSLDLALCIFGMWSIAEVAEENMS